jgi:Tfp pilus assembly protein PilO
MNTLSLSKLRNSELTERLSSGVRGLRLSYSETVFLVIAAIYAVVVISYFLAKVPARQFQLRDLAQREQIAKTALERQHKKEDQLAVQRQNADRILASLHDFESRLDDNFGKTRVIDEVNRLAKVNHVVASDFNYRFAGAEPISDQTGSESQPQPQPLPTARPDHENVYQALGIDTTVVGDYADLRRFISDLERSRQFVVIRSLAFQGMAERSRSSGPRGVGPQPIPQPAGPVPQQPGLQPAQAAPQLGRVIAATPVSLKIEMETYFQK